MPIKIETLSESEIKKRNITSWPVWEKEVSRFDWRYDSIEECYLLAGHVKVETPDGETIEFKAGHFVTFPKDLSCVWDIQEPVKKHYNFK